MVQTVLFSSMTIGVNLNTDIGKGVFDRFRSLPIPQSASDVVGAAQGPVREALVGGQRILMEGAQGTLLDFDAGTRSSQTGLGRTICLDLDTTGLSGGAGVVIETLLAGRTPDLVTADEPRLAGRRGRDHDDAVGCRHRGLQCTR